MNEIEKKTYSPFDLRDEYVTLYIFKTPLRKGGFSHDKRRSFEETLSHLTCPEDLFDVSSAAGHTILTNLSTEGAVVGKSS